MKVAKHHYSKYLLSVHFERGFVPETLDGQIEMCKNFLSDLGDLARKNGRRLHATYSVCSGNNGLHAHFAVSWLPTYSARLKTAKTADIRISRSVVMGLFAENYFFVDNPTQAIKRITHDKKFVTDYVEQQPKDGQSAIYKAFYIHADFVPNCSERKLQSYCSKHQFAPMAISPQNHTHNRMSTIILISVAWFILISSLLLSIF